MKICKRGLDFIQIVENIGTVRVCSWMQGGEIGNLIDNSMDEIYHSKLADKVRESMIKGEYENCDIDTCPYLANGNLEDILVEINEIPKFPSELYLAYENVCNYNCVCCTSYLHIQNARKSDKTLNYDIIETKLKDVLPYIKRIGANGCGELFCSKKILELLANWKPVSPKEEIEVSLETNGSLFDEEHWKKIENLGQYNLKVAITIMSFEEKAYQYLSGTKLSINKIINNLKYVKSLRNKGVINTLELATVMQERNFREMPQFVDRCINEFDADIVRIRPVYPGGKLDENVRWFADVRNPYHPYHEEYLEMLKDPIFKHPKVFLWSGKELSKLGQHPGIKNKKILSVLNDIIECDKFSQLIKNYLSKYVLDEVSVYGMGRIGKILVRMCENDISFHQLYDKYRYGDEFCGKKIISPVLGDWKSGKVLLIITPLDSIQEIQKEVINYGFHGKIIGVEELIKCMKEK